MFDRRDPAQAPNPEELAEYIKTPLWEEFCGYMEETYGVRPCAPCTPGRAGLP